MSDNTSILRNEFIWNKNPKKTTTILKEQSPIAAILALYGSCRIKNGGKIRNPSDGEGVVDHSSWPEHI